VYELHFPKRGLPDERSADIDEKEDSDLVIYPNPSNGLIKISTNDYIKELKIVSIDGKVLFHKTYSKELRMINSIKIPKGVHFVKVKLANGETKIKKVIIID